MQSVYRIFKPNATLSMGIRCCCYKPIKRPSLNATVKSNVLDKADAATGDTLTKQLATRILATGPITVAEYMKNVLTNPVSGYYMLNDVFGEKGDFITSPEIGQIFGELVGVWCLHEWDKFGLPYPLHLVELGPGRGTLSQDVLKVFGNFGRSDQVSLHLVEISPFLSELQAKRLCCQYTDTKPEDEGTVLHYRQGETISGIKVYWYRKIDDVPKAFSIFLAHEFFDALPIHKFQRFEDDTWHEILIDVDRTKENAFRFIASKSKTPMLTLLFSRPWCKRIINSNSYVEYSVEREQTIDTMTDRIEEFGGFALIMDYGHFGDQKDTFRAFKNHALHDPLVNPGTADLTADVDFHQIKLFAEKGNRLVTFGPVDQRDFLKRIGGDDRIKYLVKNAHSSKDSDTLKSGYDMLTNPQKMGKRFKMFSMFPKVMEEHLNKFPVSGFTHAKD